MRSLALERDDSILPFSFVLSLIVHAVILLVVVHIAARMPEEEHIYPTVEAHQVFTTEMQYFAHYSADQRIFSASAEGVTFATHGDVRVAADQLQPAPDRPLAARGTTSQNVTPVESRRYYGDQSQGASQPAAAAAASGGANAARPSQYRASLNVPEGPDGIVEAWHAREDITRLGTAAREQTGGPAGALRSGTPGATTPTSSSTRPTGYREGVLDIPGRPMNLAPTTPQPGQTLDHRPYAEPASAGPSVLDNARELARPSGEGPRPPGSEEPGSSGRTGYGPRRIVYQPLPVYPEWAERDRVQATPQFDITIGPDGRISRVRLAVTSGYAELDRLSEAQVRRWIYEPRPGQAEEKRIVVKFVLRNP